MLCIVLQYHYVLFRKRKIGEITESHRSAGHAKWKINKGTQMKRRAKPRRAIL